MKSMMKWLILAAILGCALIACDSGGGGGGGGSSAIGDTLTLSGKVYTFQISQTTGNITWTEYTGEDRSFAKFSANGTITNGNLSFSIGTPPANFLESLDDAFSDLSDNYNNLVLSPSSAQAAVIDLFQPTSYDWQLAKRNLSISGNANSYTSTEESVSYVYVDREVTISGKGKESTYSYGGYGSEKVTTRDINITLNPGWNAVTMKTESKGSMSSDNTTSTVTISKGNPSYRWVLSSYDDYY